MLTFVWVRYALVLVFGYVCFATPGSDGWPWGVDQWLWTGLRDYPLERIRYLPLLVAGLMVAADVVARFLPPVRLRARRRFLWAAAVALATAGWFLAFRVRHWLGDLHGVDQWPLPDWKLETAEPLGALTWHYTMHWADRIGLLPSEACQLVSVLSGGFAAAALFLWAERLTDRWPLLLLMMVSAGFTVLFYGYPEKGTPKSLALLCWYVYAGTRALQSGSTAWMLASSVLLSLAALMHGGALSFLPAHAWVIWRQVRWTRAFLGVAGFLVPIAVIAAYAWAGAPYVGGKWGNVAAPMQWIKAYCITNCGYDFFSWRHLRDIVNCLLVLAPVATLCLPEALFRAHGSDPVARWLALGSLGFLFLSSFWFPVFGYYADWDIFSLTPYVVSALSAYVALRHLPAKSFQGLAVSWIVSNGIHTYSFWRAFQKLL